MATQGRGALTEEECWGLTALFFISRGLSGSVGIDGAFGLEASARSASSLASRNSTFSSSLQQRTRRGSQRVSLLVCGGGVTVWLQERKLRWCQLVTVRRSWQSPTPSRRGTGCACWSGKWPRCPTTQFAP